MIKFDQIHIAQFTVRGENRYSILGLSETGQVYRFIPKIDGWVRFSAEDKTQEFKDYNQANSGME